MLKRIILGLAIASVIAIVGVSTAADTATVNIIKARQSNLKDIGGAFKAIRDQLKVSTPNFTVIKQAAQQIRDLQADQSHWFPKGSGPEAGVKTAAKPEIWSDPQGFKAALDKLSAEAPKLVAAADTNDINAVRAQVGAVGGACKGCHDKYREPDKD